MVAVFSSVRMDLFRIFVGGVGIVSTKRLIRIQDFLGVHLRSSLWYVEMNGSLELTT